MKIKFFKKFFIFAFGDIISKVIPFIMLPVVAKYLTVAEYGEYSLFLTWLDLAAILLTFSGGAYFSYYYLRATSEFEKSEALATPLIVMTFNFLILFVISIFASQFEASGVREDFIIVIPICAFMMSLMNHHLLIEQIKQRALIVSCVRVFYSLISSILIVGFLKYGFGLHGRVYAGLISYAPVLVIAWYISYRFIDFKDAFAKGVNHFYSYSIRYLPTSLSWWVKSGVDRIIVGAYLSTDVLGNFSLASQLSSVIVIVTSAIGAALTPHIYKYYNINNNEMLKKFILVFSFVIVITAAVYCSVLNVTFEYLFSVEYLTASTLIPYILLGVTFQGLFMFISPFLMAADERNFLMNCGILSTILHVLLSIFLVKEYGVNGIVLSGVVSYGILVLCSFYKLYMIFFLVRRV